MAGWVPTAQAVVRDACAEVMGGPPRYSRECADQSTLLFSPDAPMLPATIYTATLDAALTDLAGTPLGEPFSWSFSTPAPALLRHTPASAGNPVVNGGRLPSRS